MQTTPKAFSKWLSAVGCETQGIEIIETHSTGLGWYATQDIDADVSVLKTSSKSLLNSALYQDSRWVKEALAQGISLNPNEQAAVFLAGELNNPQSILSPWLAILPNKFDSFVYDLPPHIEELYKDTLAHYIATSSDKANRAKWEQLSNSLPSFDIDWQTYSRAKRLVNSRSFLYHDSNSDPMVILSPTTDLFNHHTQPNSKVITHIDGSAIEIRTTQAVRAGEEICHSYHRTLSNAIALLNFGFVIPNNPNIACILVDDGTFPFSPKDAANFDSPPWRSELTDPNDPESMAAFRSNSALYLYSLNPSPLASPGGAVPLKIVLSQMCKQRITTLESYSPPDDSDFKDDPLYQMHLRSSAIIREDEHTALARLMERLLERT